VPGDLRQLKALDIAARCRVVPKDGVWLVPSQANAGAFYHVRLDPGPACGCDDFQLRRQPCKHVRAAQLVCARDHDGRAPPFDADVVPARPTYRQNWPLYNQGQQTEKHRFQALLADLARFAAEPPARRGGEHVQHGQGEVRGRGAEPYGDGDGQRGAVQVPLPQPLRGASVAPGIGHRAGLLGARSVNRPRAGLACNEMRRAEMLCTVSAQFHCKAGG